MSVAELIERIPHIDWVEYFTKLMDKSVGMRPDMKSWFSTHFKREEEGKPWKARTAPLNGRYFSDGRSCH